MKYVRLTSAWGSALGLCTLAASAISPFGLSAERHVGEAMIYPVLRFYRGGIYASITESTLERVFEERLLSVAGPMDAEKREGLSKRLATHLYQLCVENRIDPAFVLSVIQAESSFQVDIVSPAGAIGLMQLMPDTARVVVLRNPGVFHKTKISATSLRDPFLNLSLGVVYLKELKEKYIGLSPYYHLAAYNMGPHRLDTLRANPTFKPEKTLKYYQDIMRGVNDWRHYRSREEQAAAREILRTERALSKVTTIQSGRARLRPVTDVASQSLTRKI